MPPPQPVRGVPAELRNMAEVEQTIGTVVANATVNVSSQVDGRVAATDFKEGDIVKVKVLEVDKQGRIRLSMKAVTEDERAGGATA